MDWLKIKNEYISTNTSYRKLAEKYGVNKDTIANRAKREKWKELREKQADAIQTKTIQQTANRMASKEANRIARIDALTDRLLNKLEEATEQLNNHLVTSKIKTREIEYSSENARKPTKETITEEEKKDVVSGDIDRTGLKQLSEALKNIKDIQISILDAIGDEKTKDKSLISAIKESAQREWENELPEIQSQANEGIDMVGKSDGSTDI